MTNMDSRVTMPSRSVFIRQLNPSRSHVRDDVPAASEFRVARVDARSKSGCAVKVSVGRAVKVSVGRAVKVSAAAAQRAARLRSAGEDRRPQWPVTVTSERAQAALEATSRPARHVSGGRSPPGRQGWPARP